MKSLIALLVLAVAACSSAVRVEPPSPQGPAAAACKQLGAALPRELDGEHRVATEPPSPYVAVWGAGQITVRCGVDRPAAMAPTDTVNDINGVAWFTEPNNPTLFTAVNREAYVQVTISVIHQPGDILVSLADPIKATIP
ncbi:hypothetical protein Aph01nite_53250 [Acrocarpospora phusangensis]|uniref:Lipoprotein n=1 Tax=Acrocarpospora phusangensis TaxID=1070424 RepID=A0A919QGJ8_9ACTN|nr:DUF3515 domain-containing protein [Acrocarpospora phusangensis]GIH27015.1 hypothetical protein Aph01nite_53250 [Acrocarpospora phusangensis]